MNPITALFRALFLMLLLAVALPFSALAQEQETVEYDTSKVVPPPRHGNMLSPMDISTAMLGDTYVKVVYGSPRKRDRVIFGDLVPYGELWRTGANEATELTTTGDLDIDGQTLPAGTYSVFTIPGEEAWTVIFNSALGQLGAADYDESKDVLRVEAPVMETEKPYEGFTIMFEDTDDGKTLAMAWDGAKVALPVQAGAM